MKRYIFALVTLLMLSTATWAVDYIRIMGTTYTSDNMSTDEVTVVPSSGTLSAGTIKYNRATHTVTIDGVVAQCHWNLEFISNLRTDKDLTVIANSACTINGWYIIDLDNEGENPSQPTNLIFKSGRADNQPVDLNFTTTNADVIITKGSVNCKLINLNINVTCLTDDRGLFYFKSDHPTVELYNCYISVGQLFHTAYSPNLTINCFGMKWLSGDNQGTPFEFKREINRSTSMKTVITNENNLTLTQTTVATPVTNRIAPLTDLRFFYGEEDMEPSNIIVQNSAGGYNCKFPITADDLNDYLPTRPSGGPYTASFTETKRAIVTEDPIVITYYINPKSITSADITVEAVPTQIFDGTNAVEPIVSIYDNGTLLTEDEDYTLSYGDNNAEGINAGTVTITGIGGYTDSRTVNFNIVNEYFTVSGIRYRTISSTTVSVGAESHAAAIATTLTEIIIPATVSHVVATPFQVTGVENGAFTGCSALHYIDMSAVTGYTPTSLERTVTAAPFYGVPKQALVYLTGTPVVGENYVYKVADGDYRCHELKIYDDTDGAQTGFTGADYQWGMKNIHPFTAKSIVNTRKMKTGQHYTVFLPYALPISESFKAYRLAGTNTSKDLIGFEEVTGTIATRTPCVIIPSMTGQLLSTADVTVQTFDENDIASITVDGVTLKGTMKYISGTNAVGKYIMQSGNTWKKITGGDYTDGSNKACILPMRAYIDIIGSGARPYLRAAFTDATGNTTTIEQLRLDEKTDGAVYDLQGRKVQTPMRKGIYIINGEKKVK